MIFDFIIECHYLDGTVKFTPSTKYMRTAIGRPVEVVVHGKTDDIEKHSIKMTAAIGAEVIYD